MTPMDPICRTLGISVDEFNALAAEGGQSVAQRIRNRYGIEDDEDLATGLFERRVLGWAEARILRDDAIWVPDPDAEADLQELLANPPGSTAVGRYVFPEPRDIPDDDERAHECETVDLLVFEAVHQWLRERGAPQCEVRLGELAPGEVRVYVDR